MAEIAALRIDCSNLEFHGHGYTTEPVSPVADYLFASRPVDRLEIVAAPASIRVVRSAVSCGRAPPEALSTCVVGIETWR